MFLPATDRRRNTLGLVMAILLRLLHSSCHRVLATATEDGRQRIVAGENAKPHEFPSYYYVSLRYNFAGRFCGGSIINQDWIVTAAHCVIFPTAAHLRNFTVVAGETSSYDEVRQIVNVTQIIIHRKYNPKAAGRNFDGWDIALVRVHPSIRFSYNASPANLPPCKTYETGNAWATGFGAYNLTVPSPPQKFLQKKEVQMIPNSECLHNKTDPPTRANERVICTRQDGGGVCFGDSGSPLYVWTKNVTWTQVGIVSGGTSCNNGLGLFVKISHFVGWIHRRISGCGNFPTSHFDQP